MRLSSDRLQVTVANPGSAPNTTCRFDRSGFLTSVLLDGRFEFCTREPENLPHPSSGGCGLCCEFVAPLLYDQPCFNNFFPKPGIGLMKKKGDTPYCFYETYQTIPFPVTWEQTRDSAIFHMAADAGQGYRWEETRQITVKDCQLTNTVILRNTGSRELAAAEYCHNFLTLEGLPIGESYHIGLPGIRSQAGSSLPGTLQAEEGGFSFSGYHPGSALYTIPRDDILPCRSFPWEITHDRSKVWIKGRDRFCPCQISIWYIGHMICLEIFYPIHLLPGEEISWERSLEFGAT